MSPASGEDGWLSLARGGLATGAHEMGGRWKSQNRKNVYLSPYVEKTFKLKGNKKFRTWTKKSLVFFVFRDPYVLCIYVMNILMYVSHVAVSGYGTEFARFSTSVIKLGIIWSSFGQKMENVKRKGDLDN